MRRLLVILILAAGTLLPASTLTVDDLVSIALRHSPDIDLGRYEVESARQQSRSAESVQLPQVGLSIHLDRENDHYRHSGDEHIDTLEGTLSATQLLYDFGKSAGEIESAHESEAASREQMHQIVSDKILEVKQRYYDALKALTLIRVYEKNLRLQEKHLYRAKKYLKAGIKTAVDVTDAKLELEKARKALSDARFLYKMKRTLLEESLGTIPEGGNYRLYGGSSDPKKWRLPRHERSLKSLLADARKHRPLLLSMTHEIRSAEATARSKALHMTPTLELYGEAGTKGLDAGKDSWGHEKVGVRMSWDLFTGYRDSAEAETARIEAMKAHATRQQALLALRREVTGAYLNLKHMREQFVLSQNIVRQAKEKYRQAKKRYVNDLADYVELQDSRQDYIRALAGLVNSYYEYFAARAELEHAVGK